MATDNINRYLPTAIIVLFTVVTPLVFIVSSRSLGGGAGLFPTAMSVVMLCCAALSFRRRYLRGGLKGGTAVPAVSLARLAAVGGVLFLFLPLAEFFGFYAVTFVYVVIGFLAFAGRFTARNLLQALLVAALFTAAEKLVFYNILLILTPAGLLF